MTPGRIGRRVVRGLAALVALFLLFDGGARLVGFAPYVQGTIESGYGAQQAPVIGLALLVPLVLYFIPRSAVKRTPLLAPASSRTSAG